MDQETLTMLGDMVSQWATDNHQRLQRLERQASDKAAHEALFAELHGLGLLDLLGEAVSHNDMQAVAEMAYQLAHHSPSVALMVVQQNLAAWLLAESGQPAASGWVALPLFDSVGEWQYQPLAQQSSAKQLTGRWQGIPLLSMAQQLLLPLVTGKDDEFRLIRLPLSLPVTGVSISRPLHTLGLKACPQNDLACDGISLTQSATLLKGSTALQAVSCLWSQAEVCIMALRAGIANASYQTALDYAGQRWQGGKLIINHSLIRKMLADFYRDVAHMDNAWRSTAQQLTANQPLSPGQMGTALQTGKRLPWLTSDGIQILGGVGYMEDYPQEQRYRDAKQCEFLLGHPQAREFTLWQATL